MINTAVMGEYKVMDTLAICQKIKNFEIFAYGAVNFKPLLLVQFLSDVSYTL